MYIVMGIGLVLSLGGLTGMLCTKSRKTFLVSVMLMILGIVMYFGPLMGAK